MVGFCGIPLLFALVGLLGADRAITRVIIAASMVIGLAMILFIDATIRSCPACKRRPDVAMHCRHRWEN